METWAAWIYEHYQALLPAVLAPLHFLVMFIAAAHVVLTKRDARAAIGWTGVIVLTPFIGSILYFMLGINRIERKARKLRGKIGPAESSPGLEHCSQSQLEAIIKPYAPNLVGLTDFVRKVVEEPLLGGNKITPLIGGDVAYREMLSAIDDAQISIGMETYIFDNDKAGKLFADAFCRARERGVEVRVLVDDVGSRYTFPSCKRLFRERNIPFALFLRSLIPWQLQYTNMRNHRKILTIDGKIGFTGGMNIREGHMESSSSKHPVGDLHFRLDGPIVGQLQECFAADWEFCTNEHLQGYEWFPQLNECGVSLARGIADGPELIFDKIQLTLQGAIDCAQKSLTIVTPYFLPDQPLIIALNVAAMRGVAVTIVLPEHGNLRLVQWAATAQLWQMLQRGCRVFVTPKPFDHTKLVIVDELWTLFGSANWDPRSLRLNFEFNVEAYDRELAQRMTALVEEKMLRGREVTLEEVDARPLWKKLRDGTARLAQPYL